MAKEVKALLVTPSIQSCVDFQNVCAPAWVFTQDKKDQRIHTCKYKLHKIVSKMNIPITNTQCDLQTIYQFTSRAPADVSDCLGYSALKYLFQKV